MSQPPNQRNMPYGGPHQQQQQGGGYNPGRPGTSAWQPAAPTSHQMAGQQMYQQQQQRPGMMPQQYAMQNQYAMQQYMMQQQYYQQQGYSHQDVMHRGPEGAYQGNMYGGAAVYAPPPNMQQRQGAQQSRPTIQPPAAKKISVITDKDGNPIDFGGLGSSKAAPAASAPAPSATATATATAEGTKPVVAVAPATTDAGAMMRQKALEALQRDKATKKAEEEAAAKKKAEEEEAKKKAEEEAAAAAKKAEEEAAAKKQAEEAAAKKAEEEAAAAKAAEEAAKAKASVKRRVYTKEEMLKLRSLPVCMTRPTDLPEREIVKGPSRVGGGGGGGDRRQRNEGGGSWQRGAAPPNRRNSTEKGERRGSSNAGQWARGQAPPKQQNRGGRGGRGQQPFYDGPVEKLVKSENAWRPKKNVNAVVAAEKAIKSILNKMTKEKFDRLSTQMCDIPISSYEVLALMIGNVFEKAVDEPTFGDMYGDLCVRLSEKVQTDSFVQIIESDEEPPTDDGEMAQPGSGESSANSVYRWSNDVGTNDSELVGPYQSVEECFDAALSGENIGIVERGEMELELVKLQIKQGTFVKVLKKKVLEEGEEGDVFYTVYFPVANAEECGQQLSKIFLSERECASDARKENSFKLTLLNKCQEEFSKEDIYADWKKEKAAYEETKDKLTEAERVEQEEELEFRRMKIKKQMLGNIKFIGQLYKKSLIKEKILMYCVSNLLKLELDDTIKSKTPVYRDTGVMDIDEEDHEAICSMFTTIGSTIDQGSSVPFVNLCFQKIMALSNYKKLGSRTRFMYKDLIELRENKWVPRRTTEKAKTIGEIRKDFEREMREQKEQDQQMAGNFRGGPRGGDFGRNDRRGSDFRANPRASNFGKSRPAAPKPVTATDDDGFTTIVSGGNKKSSLSRAAAQVAPQQAESEKLPEPLDPDMLRRRIASIRGEFMQDPSNTTELLMSVDELRGTPDYGVKLVEENADRLIDCKDAERSAINSMFKVLVENGKISGEDVTAGLGPVIECLDSMVMDAPKAYEYFGDFMSTLISVNALEISYICQEASKMLEFSPQAPGDIMMALAQSMKSILGVEGAKSELERNAAEIEKLVGAEKWAAVKGSI
eukprot:Nitzschia sp. Nitz4//scaffold23_size168460//46245//49725//NITZ4_002210-RA/size168460-snap-gene-0.153-mRNA-1//-1//CDS//3329543608//2856//frame0